MTGPRNYLERAWVDLTANGLVAEEKHGAGIFRACLAEGRKSPRFQLPDGGVCMTEKITHLQAPARLPYPSITLEFLSSWGMPTICFASQVDIPATAAHLGGMAVFLNMACCFENEWIWWPYSALIPLDDLTWQTEQGLPAAAVYDITGRPLTSADQVEDSSFYQAGVAVLSLVQALQCQNVATDIIPASVPLNKKRARAGKLPFVDYHVLVLKNTQADAIALGGTHNSPRRHIRRGHVRRLPNGNRIWIEQMFVGRADLGFVHKDYRVSA